MVVVFHPCQNYRLGDLVTGYFERAHIKNRKNPSSSCFCENWPSSIGCEFVNSTLKHKLIQIVKKRNKNATFLKNDSLIVHLRLGDVLDLPFYTDKRKIGQTYIKQLSYYKALRIPKSVKTIYIVSNLTYRAYYGSNNSMRYFTKVTEILRSRKYNVTFFSGKHADNDFLFMTRAYFFVKSGGKFSKLAADIVKNVYHKYVL